MISAIVFDFDGVLVDSEPLHLRSYQEVLEPVGLSLPREKYYSSYLGYDDAGVFKAIAEARDWPLDEQKLRALIDEKCRVFEALKSDGTGGDMLYPGATECVARLAGTWPEEGTACLVWGFESPQPNLFSVDELRAIANLQPIEQFKDGAIYVVTRRHAP